MLTLYMPHAKILPLFHQWKGLNMGRPVVDLTGQKFGKLFVIGLSNRRSIDNKPYWLCHCDCGIEKEIAGFNLKSGQSQSCGCERRARAGWDGIHRDNIFEDLTGFRFGLWNVRSKSRKVHKITYWNCECDCGSTREVAGNNLKSGKTKSCGCLHKQLASEASKKHGFDKSHSFYRAWVGMKNRCNNTNDKVWKHYGGRGISVCLEWKEFENFYKDMWPTWQSGLSLDRINNDKGYEPLNCRWATQSEQMFNRRHWKAGTLAERGWIKTNEKKKIDENQLSFEFFPGRKEYIAPVALSLKELGLED